MADEPHYTEFEQGERQALLQVRSFITRHGNSEVDAYCAQRLHDMMMDARARRPQPPRPSSTVAVFDPE